MATTTSPVLSRASELSVAIQLMAQRMADSERKITRGIFAAPISEPFLDTDEYQRLDRRRHYQQRAMSRLLDALTDLVPR